MMANRFGHTLPVLLPILFACEVLFAAPCLIVADDSPSPPRAIFVSAGERQELRDNPISKDCSQLEVIEGTIHLLYETPKGLTRRTCVKGEKACGVTSGTLPSWLEQFKHVPVPGGKKMDKDVARLPGIPRGRILSAEKAATFNFSKAGLSQWNLTLTETRGKGPLFSKSGSDPIIHIPANLLRPGGKYTWLIDTGGQRYKGGFDILDSTKAEGIKREMDEIKTSSSGSLRTKKLDELIVLYDNNLDYEVELLRGELKI